MGNAASGETEPTMLKEELADMHRSLQALSTRCRPPPVLRPGQISVDNVIISTREDMKVVLGPVVGKVEFQCARVLLEVNRRAVVTAHVSTLDVATNSMVEVPQLNVVAVSGDNVYDLQSGETTLWKDVRERVEQGETQTVLHLGGQVAMERMFDKAVQLLLLHGEGLTNDATDCNLMMWNDADIYPRFTTRDEFYIDHEQPTLRMQAIRTVTRSARRLYHEYQRQLWDDDFKQLVEREVSLKYSCEV
ncbi:hypothetical protein JG687_00005901 [Phytophthora cactorum]|uniref:Uncharacterized protein n=1 Tax=Phytophthora cactorum TaxID=29920 RepID=A0A8T1UL11_9STRA|nr:hypothetical protein JG687_00005901 [Phytophthora cactorum]